MPYTFQAEGCIQLVNSWFQWISYLLRKNQFPKPFNCCGGYWLALGTSTKTTLFLFPSMRFLVSVVYFLFKTKFWYDYVDMSMCGKKWERDRNAPELCLFDEMVQGLVPGFLILGILVLKKYLSYWSLDCSHERINLKQSRSC